MTGKCGAGRQTSDRFIGVGGVMLYSSRPQSVLDLI